MGLGNREGGKFVNILGGKFSQRVDESTPGAVARVNKEGKTVFEKYHDFFVGKLIDIKTQDGAYGKNWLFVFEDGGEVYNLQLSYSNSYATAFLKMLPNIDLTKEMKVSPSLKMVDGKNKSSLFVEQDGKTVKHAYTKDNPNGLPQMEQVQVKGQLVWDDTKRIEFLHNMVQTQILPQLSRNQVHANIASSVESVDDLAKSLGETPGADDDF